MLRRSIVKIARICFILFVVILAGYCITATVAIILSNYLSPETIENFINYISELIGI